MLTLITCAPIAVEESEEAVWKLLARISFRPTWSYMERDAKRESETSLTQLMEFVV
jgi:hypothetical protein